MSRRMRYLLALGLAALARSQPLDSQRPEDIGALYGTIGDPIAWDATRCARAKHSLLFADSLGVPMPHYRSIKLDCVKSTVTLSTDADCLTDLPGVLSQIRRVDDVQYTELMDGMQYRNVSYDCPTSAPTMHSSYTPGPLVQFDFPLSSCLERSFPNTAFTEEEADGYLAIHAPSGASECSISEGIAGLTVFECDERELGAVRTGALGNLFWEYASGVVMAMTIEVAGQLAPPPGPGYQIPLFHISRRAEVSRPPPTAQDDAAGSARACRSDAPDSVQLFFGLQNVAGDDMGGTFNLTFAALTPSLDYCYRSSLTLDTPAGIISGDPGEMRRSLGDIVRQQLPFHLAVAFSLHANEAQGFTEAKLVMTASVLRQGHWQLTTLSMSDIHLPLHFALPVHPSSALNLACPQNFAGLRGAPVTFHRLGIFNYAMNVSEQEALVSRPRETPPAREYVDRSLAQDALALDFLFSERDCYAGTVPDRSRWHLAAATEYVAVVREGRNGTAAPTTPTQAPTTTPIGSELEYTLQRLAQNRSIGASDKLRVPAFHPPLAQPGGCVLVGREGWRLAGAAPGPDAKHRLSSNTPVRKELGFLRAEYSTAFTVEVWISASASGPADGGVVPVLHVASPADNTPCRSGRPGSLAFALDLVPTEDASGLYEPRVLYGRFSSSDASCALNYFRPAAPLPPTHRPLEHLITDAVTHEGRVALLAVTIDPSSNSITFRAAQHRPKEMNSSLLLTAAADMQGLVLNSSLRHIEEGARLYLGCVPAATPTDGPAACKPSTVHRVRMYAKPLSDAALAAKFAEIDDVVSHDSSAETTAPPTPATLSPVATIDFGFDYGQCMSGTLYGDGDAALTVEIPGADVASCQTKSFATYGGGTQVASGVAFETCTSAATVVKSGAIGTFDLSVERGLSVSMHLSGNSSLNLAPETPAFVVPLLHISRDHMFSSQAPLDVGAPSAFSHPDSLQLAISFEYTPHADAGQMGGVSLHVVVGAKSSVTGFPDTFRVRVGSDGAREQTAETVAESPGFRAMLDSLLTDPSQLFTVLVSLDRPSRGQVWVSIGRSTDAPGTEEYAIAAPLLPPMQAQTQLLAERLGFLPESSLVFGCPHPALATDPMLPAAPSREARASAVVLHQLQIRAESENSTLLD